MGGFVDAYERVGAEKNKAEVVDVLGRVDSPTVIVPGVANEVM